MPKKNTLEDILSRKIVDKNGCWLYTGDRTASGYGRARLGNNREQQRVHRLSAHYYLGYDLNSALNVLHKLECKSRRCFNPEHLYIGTQLDNASDRTILNKRKFCEKGHELDITGTRAGGRCRLCQNEYERERYNKNKGNTRRYNKNYGSW